MPIDEPEDSEHSFEQTIMPCNVIMTRNCSPPTLNIPCEENTHPPSLLVHPAVGGTGPLPPTPTPHALGEMVHPSEFTRDPELAEGGLKGGFF